MPLLLSRVLNMELSIKVCDCLPNYPEKKMEVIVSKFYENILFSNVLPKLDSTYLPFNLNLCLLTVL